MGGTWAKGPVKNQHRRGFLSELTNAQWVRCFAALMLVFLDSWLLNQYMFPQFTLVYGMAREFGTLSSCLTNLSVAIVASLRPDVFQPRRFGIAALVAFVAGLALVALGIATNQPFALAAGSMAMNGGRTLITICACIVLISMSGRASALCIAGSLAMAYVLRSAIVALPDIAGTTLFVLAPIAILALTRPYAVSLFDDIRANPAAATLALTEPRSFLPYSHILFVSFFVFRIAFGYSLTFGAVQGTPPFTLLPLLPLALVAIQAAVAGKAAPADILYQVACLFVLAGFLAVLIPQVSGTAIANTLLATGGDCFSVLMYYTLAAIGRRNPLQALPIFAWGQCASIIGTLAGTSLGHLTNGLFASDASLIPATVAVCVLAFVAFNLTAVRGFGFEKTIEGVEGVPRLAPGSTQVVSEPIGKDSRGIDFIDRQCEALAVRFGLTERELDVFRLLAHGRNVPFIEEELVISRNTIKTHIKHLYQKMDLHSQQELIDMAETY
ncbi:MAG: LuxR C-terminal-related transcriptional regulator [Gordonibacter sp.]|uniref:LuxR C-terminal-related transcriptional regulator n=1 Tax=Gordonibacter sp. TaxID=1968902 RepID=UPI002FC71A82